MDYTCFFPVPFPHTQLPVPRAAYPPWFGTSYCHALNRRSVHAVVVVAVRHGGTGTDGAVAAAVMDVEKDCIVAGMDGGG